MTDPNTALPPSLRRALELLADPPTNPDVSKGYLDLLGTTPIEDAAPPKSPEPRRYSPRRSGRWSTTTRRP
jgi:arsenite methyltransferase